MEMTYSWYLRLLSDCFTDISFPLLMVELHIHAFPSGLIEFLVAEREFSGISLSFLWMSLRKSKGKTRSRWLELYILHVIEARSLSA